MDTKDFTNVTKIILETLTHNNMTSEDIAHLIWIINNTKNK